MDLRVNFQMDNDKPGSSSTESQSLNLIRTEAKKCPKCQSPTQKTGVYTTMVKKL